MIETEIIENGLYRLQPKSKDESTWCKHNLLIASKKSGKWVFTDTYWSSYQDQTRYGFDEIKDRITFEFDMNFAKGVILEEYDQYDDKDKFWIPMGGGSQRYLIDSRAKKSKEKVIELLEYRISSYQSKIKSLQYDIDHNIEEHKQVKDGKNLDEIRIW